MEYRKNDIVTLKIEDCGIDGEGIGKADGFTVFVKDAVIGDTVRAKIMKAKKNYCYGRLEEIITPSPDRVEPKCQFARQCGGCTLQHLAYEKQLEYKFNKVKNCLERIGGLENIEEKMEQAKEEAQKIKEKQEENKPDKSEDTLAEKMVEQSKKKDDVDKKIKKMVDDLNLLMDDIKGIEVDANI